MNRIATAIIVLGLGFSVACSGSSKTTSEDETSTETSTNTVSTSADTPFEVATAWLASPDAKSFSSSLAGKTSVERLWKRGDAYLALVGGDTAGSGEGEGVVLTLERGDDEGWAVTNAEAAATSVLWPGI